MAIDTPTPGTVLASAAVIAVIGASGRVLKTFECMKHEGEMVDPVEVMLFVLWAR